MAVRRSRGRRWGWGSAAAVLAVGLAGLAVPAQAAQSGQSYRYAGPNRYATAGVLFGQFHGVCNPSSLVVASGEDYHDALAGNFLAGQNGTGGELLTQNAQLSSEASERITACGDPSRRYAHVYAVDGGAQLADATVAAVQARATYQGSSPFPVERVHGADAYAGAAAVAQVPGAVVGSTQKYGRTAVVASGENFPDALAASPLVYSQHLPLLFTQRDALPDVTAAALKALGIQTVILLGGPAAVSPAVETQLRTAANVVRVAGADRQLTATALAGLEISDFGFSNDQVFLARGDDYPDALAGGQFAGGGGAYQPVLLAASPTDLGGGTADYLHRNSPQLRGRVGALGGTAAITDDTWYAARRAADQL